MQCIGNGIYRVEFTPTEVGQLLQHFFVITIELVTTRPSLLLRVLLLLLVCSAIAKIAGVSLFRVMGRVVRKKFFWGGLSQSIGPIPVAQVLSPVSQLLAV